MNRTGIVAIWVLAAAIFCPGGARADDKSKFVWRNCSPENATGTLIDVVVKDCDTEKCALVRNENATLTITFKSNVLSKSVRARVQGELFTYKQPFPLPNPTACEEVGLTCPLQPDTTYVYTNTIFVKPSYPRVTVDIYWELKDDQGKDLFCAVIPAHIVPERRK
ncbi:unnamed protein product [Phyllotreta striolata]|uniref:MD-2-related lipid-recognition domain-containing protein n=1 Tax=Phyllotreta striolata TaxID=444603 RepID=A0A9N9TJK5_PHYSR|nr:unnamed protein product [Phyllotreta striolata]